MARSLGELFPIIVAILGVYFLLAAMFSPSVLTLHDEFDRGYLDRHAVIELDGVEDGKADAEVLVGPNPAPGLYAIASALCFGSVLLWSRLTPTPAKPAMEAA
jgi:hypothetical protein